MERRKALRKITALREKRERAEKEAKLIAELKQHFFPPGPDNVDDSLEATQVLLSPHTLAATFEENFPYEETDVFIQDIGFETPDKKAAPRNYTIDMYASRGLTPTMPRSPDDSFDACLDSNEFIPRAVRPGRSRIIQMYKQKGVNPTAFRPLQLGIPQPNFDQHDTQDSFTPMSVARFSETGSLDDGLFRASRDQPSRTIASSSTPNCFTPYSDFMVDFNPFSIDDEEDTTFSDDLLRSDLVPTPFPFKQQPMLFGAETHFQHVPNLVYSADTHSARKETISMSSSTASNKENMAPNPRKKILSKASKTVKQEAAFPPFELFLPSFDEEPIAVPIEWLHLYANRPMSLDTEDAVRDWLQEVLKVVMEVPRVGNPPTSATI